MAIPAQYKDGGRQILDKRHANGADFWATPDGRWGTGSPHSTFDCALILHELGMKRTEPVQQGAAKVILGMWQEDGRFRSAPKTAVYPCHTANAARVLCRLGYARNRRLKRTFEHLFETQHVDGGWRCNAVKLGRSAETDASNPGVTLSALDAFRFSATATPTNVWTRRSRRFSLTGQRAGPSGRAILGSALCSASSSTHSCATTSASTSTCSRSIRPRGRVRSSARR